MIECICVNLCDSCIRFHQAGTEIQSCNPLVQGVTYCQDYYRPSEGHLVLPVFCPMGWHFGPHGST